jgi:two-component system, LytTR family, sensor kinase
MAFWVYMFIWNPIIGSLIQNGEAKGLDYFLDPLAISHYILFPTIFYVNYFFILPQFFKKGKLALNWLLWLALLLLFIGLRYLIQEVLFLHWFGYTNYYEGTKISYYIFDNIYYGGILIVMSFLLWVINDNTKTQKEKFELLQENKEAQLAFLKNQVNPHFIFNTLNNIYSLVASNKNSDALMGIDKLSQLMRYMYKDGEAELVNLQNEISYINSFIALQSIRIPNKESILFSINGQIANQKIAPLILIPFIENIFKHGITNKMETPVTITIYIHSNEIELNCTNHININKKDEASGVGLTNVKKRLQLIYPNKHTLSITENENLYQTILTINLA